MQARHKDRVCRQRHALCRQPRAHIRGIEQMCKRTRADFAIMPPTGPALQRRGMGVVRDMRTMTQKQDRRRIGANQPHRGQHFLRHIDPARSIQTRQDRERFGLNLVTKAQSIAHQLACIQRPGRFDECEGRHSGQLEPPPGAMGAGGDLGGEILGLGRFGGGFERGGQQDGQMRLVTARTLGPMRQWQAKEARKAQCLHIWPAAFQRAAIGFGPHVNAERGLKRRPDGREGRTIRRQPPAQVTLESVLDCRLQDRVDPLFGPGMDGFGMFRERRRPGRADQVRVLRIKCSFPDQPDRKQIGHAVIAVATQFSLPELPTGRLRPTAQIHQQPVINAFGCIRRKAQCGRNLHEHERCLVRAVIHPPGKARKPCDFRGQIVDRVIAPCVIGPPPARGRPKRLALIEPACRPSADAARHDARPVDARGIRDQMRDGGQRLWGWVRLAKRQFHMPQRDFACIGAGGQGGLDIGQCQLACGHLVAKPCARQRDRLTRSAAKMGCG